MGRKRSGTIEPRGDRYRARLGREVLGTYDTIEQAQEAINAQIVAELEARKEDRTFGVLFSAYMDDQEKLARIRRGSARVFNDKERSLVRRWIRTAPFWRKSVDRVTRDDVRDLMISIVGAPALTWNRRTLTHVPNGRIIGTRTAEAARARLTHFFNHCRGMKGANPAHEIPIPNGVGVKIKRDADRVPHLHLDEIDRLYALPLEFFTLKFRAMYALGIYAGFRGGEIIGLEWPSIVRLYGERPELHVRRSYSLGTKTQSSQREVPMLPQLVEHVQRYVESLEARPISGPVFLKADGERYAPGYTAGWYDNVFKDERVRKTNVRHRAREYTRSGVGFRTLAKIRDHILFKHLRHTCATHLRAGRFTAERWDAGMVARLLGHTDVGMQANYVSSDVAELHEYLETNKPKVVR